MVVQYVRGATLNGYTQICGHCVEYRNCGHDHHEMACVLFERYRESEDEEEDEDG